MSKSHVWLTQLDTCRTFGGLTWWPALGNWSQECRFAKVGLGVYLSELYTAANSNKSSPLVRLEFWRLGGGEAACLYALGTLTTEA